MCFSGKCCGPSCLASSLIRVSFGLSLLLVGVAHYRDPVGYAGYVSAGFEPSWLVSLSTMWGYVLPFLLIVGGALIALGIFATIGVWAAGLALASIPAGLMLKMALGIQDPAIMQGTMNAYVWMLVFVVAVKSMRCCGGACAVENKAAMQMKIAKPTMKKPAVKKV